LQQKTHSPQACIGEEPAPAQDLPRARSSADPEYAFWTLNKLTDVGKYFRAYCYSSVLDLGFSRNEIDVLLSLTHHPEKNTVRGISETVHLSKGMISQAVESLRQKKYVSVSHDQNDRRSILITLSELSAPVLEKLREATRTFAEKITNGIPPEQLEAFSQTMAKFCANKENMKIPHHELG